MNRTFQKSVVVVGGGIVGLSCALFLQNEGMHVTLIDNAEPGESTAKWSGGLLAVSEVFPLSKPSMLKRIPAALIHRDGPLTIRGSAFPHILPWAMHFLANARASKIAATAQAMSSLMRHVYSDYQILLDACGDNNLIGQRPVMQVFDHVNGLKNYRTHIHQSQALGFNIHELNALDIAGLEPTLAGKFACGVMFNDWRAVNDTQGFLLALNRLFVKRGGERLQRKVTSLLEQKARVTGVMLDGEQPYAAEHIVIAAGMSSRHFFAQLGISIPLIAITGYKTLLTDPGVILNHPIIYADGGFCFTPMKRGLQIGGMMDFAGNGAKPDSRRVENIRQQAKSLLPQLNLTQYENGVGYRPTLPDSKPVIDRSRRFANVYMAFGHGSLGLTLGATTGRIIAQMVAGKEPHVDIACFRAERFSFW